MKYQNEGNYFREKKLLAILKIIDKNITEHCCFMTKTLTVLMFSSDLEFKKFIKASFNSVFIKTI